MPRIRTEAFGLDDVDTFSHDRTRPRRERRRGQAEPTRTHGRHARWTDLEDAAAPAVRPSKRRTADGSESFKCGRCRAFIGPTVSGGRHRNHCPLCLHSRHVDAKTPGDRASACRSLMAPVGVFFRPKGEQVLLHRCLGCGLERHNRVAADDNPLAILRLPPVPPRLGRQPAPDAVGEEEAIA